MFGARRFIVTLSLNFNPYPSCKDCVYLQPRLFKEYNRCAKFKTRHFITGGLEHEYAEYARNDKRKCGEEGKYFTQLT